MAKGVVMPEEIEILLDLHPDEVARLLRQVEAQAPALLGELLRGALLTAFQADPDSPARVRIQITPTTPC